MKPESVVELALALLNLVVKLIGPGHTSALLSVDDVSRANAVADAVAYVKFHRPPETS